MAIEQAISFTIVRSYYEKLQRAIKSDIIIVGSGPAGLVAASKLAKSGLVVTLIEKRLSPGGGIWGGSMGMNEVVLELETLPILQEAAIRYYPTEYPNLIRTEAAELACGLVLWALRSGAIFLNLIEAEDLCVKDGRVCGVVINKTLLYKQLPIDPMALEACAVIDATGHEAFLVNQLARRGLLQGSNHIPGDGPMDVIKSEAFVVNNTSEIFPGLWVAGMSVCATFGGPRMGPIFGGMLLSGSRVADLILQSLNRKCSS